MLTGKARKEAINKALRKRETRIPYLEHDIFVFGLYYFSEVHTVKSAKFHREWAKAFAGKEHLLIIAFRESAKSFYLMVAFIHAICYRHKRNMFYICYDKDIARERLFDIVTHLQTNQKLIEDFGYLFPPFQNSKDGPQKRAVSQFITTNGIRCKALGLKGKMRGSVFFTKDGMFRPDFLGLDDIDVNDSVKSVQIIDDNYHRLKTEVFGSLADDVKIICIGNVIRNDGLVLRLEKDNKNNSKWIICRQPIEEGGKITWKARFTKTGEVGKIDLIQKRKDQGEIGYNQNFNLIGYAGGNAIIKRHYIHYERPPNKKEFDRIIIGVDPSYSEKTTSDPFAITVTGHIGKKKYVLDGVKLEGELKDTPKSIPIIKSFYIKWLASRVNVESVTQEFVAKACKSAGMATESIHPVNDKVTRLMEYQAEIENGDVVFNPDSQYVNDLVANLLEFPNVAHDDDVDSMVYSFIRPAKRAV